MTDPKGVAVVGAGGHGKVVLSTLLAAGEPVAGLFDRDPERHGDSVLGLPVLGGLDELERLGIGRAVLAIGDNRRRSELGAELTGRGIGWQAAIHPAAVVHPSVVVGGGAVVFAGAVIQPDARLGAHAIVNTAASIDHDCRIGDFAHVAPGARLAGGVTLGEGAFLGVGCSVLPGVTIGAWAVVGAGAAVIRDVRAGAIVKGVPAR